MEKERELVLVESGLMFADYWQGTPGVGLFVYPDANTTVADLRTMLEAEISNIWDHIIYTFDGDVADEEEVLSMAVDAALENFFHGADLSRKPFSANEFPTDEDSEPLPWIVNMEMRDV
jgi:hypothetical protein